jgi:IS4 transposase
MYIKASSILTTDLELTEEEVVQMYAKRWRIEEFFKIAKSLLKLESEFQGRSYDMLIGHATLVCVRHIFLELERRKTLDVRTCGELFFFSTVAMNCPI